MATAFSSEDETLYGPTEGYSIPPEDTSAEMSNEERDTQKKRQKMDQEHIKKGYARIKEKVKDIRQSFSNAVTTGRRSGSGKIVFEHYDRLVSLWGGSAGTEPLSFGVDGDLFRSTDMSEDEDAIQENTPNILPPLTGGTVQQGEDCDGQGYPDPRNDDQGGVNVVRSKRKSESQVPVLIDNKRKHLQKSLSAAQRDSLLFNEAKEDMQYRKDLAEAMRQSTDSFSKALEGISNSMLQIGTGLCRSLEVMAQAMISPPQPVNQNLFYQNQQGSGYPMQQHDPRGYNHTASHFPTGISSSCPPNNGVPTVFQKDNSPD